MPEISVIVPVYNAEPYLCECIDSILNQTFPDFELILVDDGSTDKSGMICDTYAKTDSRIRVLYQPNAGQSSARNRGVQIASTDLICLIDSDDAVNPLLLEVFYRTLMETGAGVVVSGRVRGEVPPDSFFDQTQTKTTLIEVNEENLLRLFHANDTVYWTLFPCLLKKSVYERYPLTEGRKMEDNAISCKWLIAAKTVGKIEPPLYFYRENPSGTMGSPFSTTKLDYLWALEEQLRFFGDCGYSALQGEVAKLYIQDAIWIASRVKKELKMPFRSRRIIGKAVRVRKKYASTCHLSPSEERKLFKAAHPLLHRVKKKLHVQ